MARLTAGLLTTEAVAVAALPALFVDAFAYMRCVGGHDDQHTAAA